MACAHVKISGDKLGMMMASWNIMTGYTTLGHEFVLSKYNFLVLKFSQTRNFNIICDRLKITWD